MTNLVIDDDRSADVDVVVPMYCPGEWLKACVDSVTASVDVSTAVWLVDDDPESRLGPLVASRWPTAHYLPTLENRGFAAACNRGIREGRARYVLTLNQDAAIDPDYIRRLVDLLDADVRIAAAGGILRHQSSPAARPDRTIDTAGIEFRRGRRAVDIGQGTPDIGQFSGVREVFGVCAAAALYRRTALDQTADSNGVFNERFFMHKEDVDLAWRLRRAGYRAVVDGSAHGYHARGVHRAPDVTGHGAAATTLRLARLLRQERAKSARVRDLAWRNQILMLIRNEHVQDLRRSYVDIALMLVAQTIVAFALDPIATVSGRVRLFRELPRTLRERRLGPGSRALPHWLP
jgi:GT2 family glycosyltransferase